jgi:hypothetical protein
MNNDELKYWTKFSFDKMRKEGAIMPTIIPKVLAMEEFKNSGVKEEELRQSIKERFVAERQEIKNSIIKKLNRLKENKNG